MTHLLDVYFREAKAGALSQDDAGRSQLQLMIPAISTEARAARHFLFHAVRRKPPYARSGSCARSSLGFCRMKVRDSVWRARSGSQLAMPSGCWK